MAWEGGRRAVIANSHRASQENKGGDGVQDYSMEWPYGLLVCHANCCILYREKASQEGPQVWQGSLYLSRLCTLLKMGLLWLVQNVCLKLSRQTCKVLLSGLTLSVKKRVIPLMLSQASIPGNPAPEHFSLHL